MTKILKKAHHPFTYLILFLTTISGVFLFISTPLVTQGETKDTRALVLPEEYPYPGNHVIVHLTEMKIALRNGTTTIASYPILSQGKPGSYYETIGGSHINDYKTRLHFSSIGHVYMPYSVHIFGNYFIHGIPYYPNGTEVSSAYSGGCIRLTNENANIVYSFIEKGTPIIITRDAEMSFIPTTTSSSTFTSMSMTNFMVASISLEALTQDNQIRTAGGEFTTRRDLIPKLLVEKDSSVATLYAESIGTDTFISLMNQKAKALGLSNTHFIDVTSPVVTTYEDYMRFMTYITMYKSYLRTIQERGY